MDPVEEKKPRYTSYRLAARFLQQDYPKVCAAIVICALPRALAAITSGVDTPSFWIMLITRILELTCLYHLCTPMIDNFRANPAKHQTLMQLLFFGVVYWLIVRAPIVAITAIPDPAAAAATAAILIVPAVAFGMIFFFYFFPFCAGIKEHRLAAAEARWISKKDPYSPLKALVAPVAIYFLLRNITFLGSPDGREFYTTILDCLISEIPFFLSIYTSMGICFSLIEGKKWHDYGFNAYREARFDTLLSQSNKSLGDLLLPKKALLILFVSAFIGYVNVIRIYELPPSPKITINLTEVEEPKVIIQLSLNDDEYRFRGFQPHAFKIAGPKGTQIHSKPPIINFEADEAYQSASLNLEFETEMNFDEIKRIEDLHLWYFNTKLNKLDKLENSSKELS